MIANLYSLSYPLLFFPTGAPFLAMVTFIEDLSYSDSKCIVARSIKASKNSSLYQSQIDSDAVPSKRREHLLAISSFLFAVIWGFGAHLPSRYLQGWRGEMERAEMEQPMGVQTLAPLLEKGGVCECMETECNGTVVTI